MVDLSKLTLKTVALTSAWDERSRIFNRLRDLRISDDERQKLIDAYKIAADNFDKSRHQILGK